MVQRILIATDGSTLSRKAIKTGIALAAATGASVVGFHARPTFPVVFYGAPVEVSPSTIDRFDADTAKAATKYLSEIEAAAAKADVKCTLAQVVSASASDDIVRTAKKYKCDLIVMASHGRRGIRRLLLGSETSLVLTHSTIPVLVTR